MQKITKEMMLNYLVDVVGWDEPAAKRICAIFGIQYFSKKEQQEILKYNS